MRPETLEVLQIMGIILLVAIAAGTFVCVMAQKLSFLNAVLN